MPSNKTIKRRLASVESTQKITKAMNMVAASRLQKSKEYLTVARPFLVQTEKIINAFKNREDTSDTIFFSSRRSAATAYLVITSDRGLCGSYNTAVLEKALNHINKQKNEKIIVIGSKGYEYFKKNGKRIFKKYDDMLQVDFAEETEHIKAFLLNLYTSGEVDEICVVYTQFESVLTHTPSIKKILPIENDSKTVLNQGSYMQYEPDVNSFLEYAVSMYLGAFIYTVLLESSACEQAARMISMDTAVTNASDILAKLTHMYNRTRQAAITQEISEVVSNTNISNGRGDFT